MCRPGNLRCRIQVSRLPILPGVTDHLEQGIKTGASERNWASFGSEVTLNEGLPVWVPDLLCDPQTSGGLLIACDLQPRSCWTKPELADSTALP